ncbi:MAG TPA: sulfotransferase [Caulobacteraceae bacterium]
MVQVYTSRAIRFRIGSPAPPDGAGARRRDPATDEATVGAVLAALDNGDLEGSARLADEALTSGLEHPALLCIMAMALQTVGRIEDAVPYLRRAMALQPADVGIANALARCLLNLQRPAEALPVLETALKHEPRRAETYANKGQALERLGQPADAERNYLNALELQPDLIPARAGLASLCSHYGAHDEARAYAQAVLEAEPDCAPAVIAMVLAELAEGAAASAEARIRRLMAGPRPDPSLDSYLGDTLDAQGKTDEAFEAWSRCGEALHRDHASQFPGEGVLESTERTAAFLERLPAERWPRRQASRAAPDAVTTHVFLTGFPRSGTSLLGLALAGHEQVELLDEQEPLIDSMRKFAGAAGLAQLLSATESELEGLRTAYWRRAAAAGAKLERGVFVDKQPIDTLHLHLVARLFPEAKILLARRDPRDVVLSCFRRRFLLNRYTYALLGAEASARLYAAAMRLADRMGALASLDALAIRHEDLVQDFEGEMRGICGFLGMDWSDALGTFASRVRSDAIATPSASQLARGLNSDGVGQWRRYARQLRPLAQILEPWVKRFGYDRPAGYRGLAWDRAAAGASLEPMD